MPQTLQTSVVIIGAGPAGAATSFFLTKYGIHHIVLEKAIFPRDKVCGDACSGKTALVINRANPEWLEEMRANAVDFLPSWGITFIAPNGKPIDIPFHPDRKPDTKPPGFTVPRLYFDNFLFRKMPSPYCTIVESAIVSKIQQIDGKAQVAFSAGDQEFLVEAKIIVGADGDKGITRKTLLPAFSEPKSYAVGLRAYYRGVTGLHPQNFIELHFLKEVLPGYLWIFPLPGGMANVGVGILGEIVRRKKINLRERMLDAIKNNPQISSRFAEAELIDKIQGWGLPLATERLPISGESFLLTGDAASLVDPFSGEGIGNAMYSGMLAAEAIKNGLEKSDTSAGFFKATYDDVFWKRMGDELKISTTMQQMSQHHWLFNFVINKAYKSPSLQRTISCMFTDMDLRKQLGKPSFYLKVLMNR